MQIDFVVPWVNGADPVWQMKKKAYMPSSGPGKMDVGEERYRDWNFFHYWFRSIEKYAPWVRYIFLVTDHQIPDFLATDHPKLKLIDHEDYIPKEYLPTFSSHTIELNLHRIPGLSEHFVYFNDDVFLNKPLRPEAFFRNNKPCYTFWERPLVLQYPISHGEHIKLNSLALINRFFKRKNIIRHPGLYLNYRYKRLIVGNLSMLIFPYYQGFIDDHMACPMLRSTLGDVWQKAGNVLHETCLNRFRSDTDVNQYVFRYWDLARGNFSPEYIPSGYYTYSDEKEIEASIHDIKSGEHAMICINDSFRIKIQDFDMLRKRILEALQQRFPDKSSFEK